MLNFVKSHLAGKKLLFQIVALLLFNLTTLAQENWSWVNPLPQGNDLNNVFVLDENTIIAVGDRGTLLRSENKGEDWDITYRLSNIEEDIVDMQFISDQKGYLLANDPLSKILLTEDKGINWNVIAQFDSLQLNDLFFLDENIGWAIGRSAEEQEYGLIVKTTDGGHSWDTMLLENIDPYNSGFYTIQFIDSMNGWALGQNGYVGYLPWGELLKTTDGGENWSILNDSLCIALNFQFINSEVGWMVESSWSFTGQNVWISKTTDGGNTWETSYSIPASWNFSNPSFYFVNVDTGWFKWIGHIDKTTDGGISWSTISQNTPSDGGMHFSDELNGYIVGGNGGILTTQNGGDSTWVERSAITLSYSLISVDFYNESLGWTTVQGSVSPNGNDIDHYAKIFGTADAGNSWEEQFTINTTKDDVYMRDIKALSDQVVYVAGTNVYKTTNGGTNWDEVFYPGAYGFETLFFINEETGFVGEGFCAITVSNGGNIYKTTNGGNEWDTVLYVTNTPIHSIFFTNTNIGWAIVGTNIYKTMDGGDIWEELWVNNLGLKSICFKDENVGLAVGNDGVVIRTTDGGSTWEEIWNKEGYELKSVTFIDSNKAVAVGQGNNDGIIVSIDNVGGAYSIQWGSWTPGLNDVYFLDDNNGWAVGDGGTIIKTGEGISFVEVEEINEIPTNYSLSNNFPNPFNPSTKIKYSAPHSSKIVIKVYDILGNEIETLVDEEKQTGTYEITWYAEGIPSGVYFCHMKAGSFVKTIKMSLLK